jgi:hypothetical protein
MDIKQQTQNVAAQGRYGDNMLLHVNPVEMQGLASVMPLTKNPQTGQPEAFLPFIAPLLGSLGGSALLGGTMGNLAAGALGSGLATAVQTGDLKQGILAGITGFGLGSALQSAGAAAQGLQAGTEAAGTAAQEALRTAADDIVGLPGATGGVGAATGPITNTGAAITDVLSDTAAQDIVAQSLQESAAKQAAAQTFVDPVSKTVANIPYNVAPIASNVAGEAAKNPTLFQNLKQAFQSPGTIDPTSGVVSGAGEFSLGTGASNLASSLSKPSSFLPIALGEGTRGTIQAQEDFEQAMKDYELGKIREQEELMAMYPEQIPISSPYYYGKEGGIIGMQKGGEVLDDEERSVSLLPGKARIRPPREDRDELRFPPPINRLPPPPPPVGSFEAAMSGGLDAYYTPPKQLSGPVTAEAVPVIDPMTGMPMLDAEGNPVPSGQFKPSANYRPGIDPEFNYLPGGNRPASSLTGLGNFLGQTGIDFGGVNPYMAANLFSNPRIEQALLNMMEPNQTNIAPDRQNYAPNRGGKIQYDRAMKEYNAAQNEINASPMFDSFNIDMSSLYNQPYTPVNNPMTNIVPPMIDSISNMGDDFMSIDRMGNDMRDIGMPMSMVEPDPSLAAAVIAPPMAPPKPLGEDVPFIPAAMPPIPQRAPIPPIDTIVPPMPNELSVLFTPPPVVPPVQNPFIQLPTPPMRDDFMSIERLSDFPARMEEGKQIPDDAKGLQALAKTEKGKEAVRQMGFELQMGGMAPSPDEIQQLQMAVLGQIPNNDEVISIFIDKYGNEMFMMIREQILNPTGNAQTQGMIEGMGGGMDDQVLGMIGSQQPVAVSPGEYIIPADVVSGLGDGSSDAGAKELDGLLNRVRQERTNTTKQPKELNKGKVLPK